jgi:FSR family fosmidomycin resistance protein-like MFS transporter
MSAVVSSGKGNRDKMIIALVASAHYVSHMMQLAIPLLFPILHEEFGVSFTELGLVATLFFAASGLGQAFVTGALVDRYGAQRLLLVGLAILSGTTFLAGLVSSYWTLLPLGVLGGLGNSVFHPADLSIISLRVDEKLHGRGFAAHALAGALGYATAPVAVMTIAALSQWRVALILFGLAGFVLTAIIHFHRRLLVCPPAHAAAPTAGGSPVRTGYLSALLSPVFLLGFAYFSLTSFSNSGMQTFGITSLIAAYAFSLPVATLAVTTYLFGNAAGVILGGWLADRTQKHHRVAIGGMLCAAGSMFLVAVPNGWAPLVTVLMGLAGIAYGITAPSRDIIIRKAAAGAGLGSVFGFVYSGFDLGSGVSTLIFGAFIDREVPHAVFLTIAIAAALAALTVMQVCRRAETGRRAAEGG